MAAFNGPEWYGVSVPDRPPSEISGLFDRCTTLAWIYTETI